MAGEFDLVAEIPAFPAYAQPPDAFPGFSAGSTAGAATVARGSHTLSTSTDPTTKSGSDGRCLEYQSSRREGAYS
jgi:hypothetical protein